MSTKTLGIISGEIEDGKCIRLLNKISKIQSDKYKIQTVKDLLDTCPYELMNVLDVTHKDAMHLIQVISNAVRPKPLTLFQLFSKEDISSRKHLATEVKELDHALRGGLHSGYITEIVGRAGAGKTQFCLTMAVLAAVSGEGVVYVDTENKFKPERIFEICRSRNLPPEEHDMVASRITVLRPGNSRELLETIGGGEFEEMLILKKVGLILLDSIAALLRLDYSAQSHIIARQNMLSKQAAVLKYLSSSFNIPVLVTNQVTSTQKEANLFSLQSVEGASIDSPSLVPAYTYVNPALGNTWAHCVNIRLVIQQISKTRRVRTIRIAKSPTCAELTVYVEITSKGVVDGIGVDLIKKEKSFLESLSEQDFKLWMEF